MTTKLSDLRRPCEHGFFHAHCDAHPGKGSHFGVVTHKGGCSGPDFVEVSDLVEALEAEGYLVIRPERLHEILHEEMTAVVPFGEDA